MALVAAVAALTGCSGAGKPTRATEAEVIAALDGARQTIDLEHGDKAEFTATALSPTGPVALVYAHDGFRRACGADIVPHQDGGFTARADCPEAMVSGQGIENLLTTRLLDTFADATLTGRKLGPSDMGDALIKASPEEIARVTEREHRLRMDSGRGASHLNADRKRADAEEREQERIAAYSAPSVH